MRCAAFLFVLMASACADDPCETEYIDGRIFMTVDGQEELEVDTHSGFREVDLKDTYSIRVEWSGPRMESTGSASIRPVVASRDSPFLGWMSGGVDLDVGADTCELQSGMRTARVDLPFAADAFRADVPRGECHQAAVIVQFNPTVLTRNNGLPADQPSLGGILQLCNR